MGRLQDLCAWTYFPNLEKKPGLCGPGRAATLTTEKKDETFFCDGVVRGPRGRVRVGSD